MSSSRLPGKVLMRAGGLSVIEYVYESMKRCSGIDDVIVATSSEPSDCPLVDFCKSNGIAVYRGPLDDVAERFVGVVERFGFDGFVRICADSPLIDHRIVDRLTEAYRLGQYDLVTNIVTRTFPKGQSVEVLNSEVFKESYSRITEQRHREHVTKYFYENAGKYNIHNVENKRNLGDMRLCVDTYEDFLRFKKILRNIDGELWDYSLEEIIFIAEAVSEEEESIGITD